MDPIPRLNIYPANAKSVDYNENRGVVPVPPAILLPAAPTPQKILSLTFARLGKNKKRKYRGVGKSGQWRSGVCFSDVRGCVVCGQSMHFRWVYGEILLCTSMHFKRYILYILQFYGNYLFCQLLP